MSRKRSGARVLGPYADGKNYRLISIDAAGNRESVLFETEAKAERYRELLLADLSSIEHTTETAIELYKVHLRERGNSPGSVKTVVYGIKRMFPAPLVLATLTPKKCKALYDDLCRRPMKQTGQPPSADTHRAAVKLTKAFLEWCIGRGWLAKNPCATDVVTRKLGGIELVGKKRPRGKSLGKSGAELRVKESRAWYEKALELANAGNDGATCALIALLLGMRASEIVKRKVADIDSDQAECDLVWIPCSKTEAGRRTLEVPAVLQPLLQRLVAGRPDSEPLFLSHGKHRGKARDRGWVRKQVHAICDAAGVPRVTAHAMRGLLATITSERGMAGHLIAATLGHESYEGVTAIHYARPGAAEAGSRRRGWEVLDGGLKVAK